MSDIFREVEEDVRRERIEKLWKRYGDYVIAGAAVLILGVAGYKLWQHYEQLQALKASAAYAAAAQLSDADAARAFEKIAREAPSGYASVAKLTEAGALLASGDSAHAIALYKAIVENDKTGLGEVARIREAWALADTASKADLQNLLAPLDTPTSAWRFMAREILAYADFRDLHLKQAQKEYESLAAEPSATPTQRQRAAAMASFIKTGGAANFGTVPAPAPPSPNAAQGNAPQ